ncbi:hypothetical protein L9F63_014918, partial [Diploptera punctata]
SLYNVINVILKNKFPVLHQMSNNDEELSDAELQDDDSEDALSRLPVEDVGDPEVLAKLKQQEREEREEIERELKVHAQTQSRLSPSRHSPRDQVSAPSAAVMVPPPSFSLPLPFPFPHPVNSFLPPISAASAPPPLAAPTPNFPPSSTAAAVLQNSISSASSHSSESSSSSQQTWSFEEQFKQVRQAITFTCSIKKVNTGEFQSCVGLET